MNLSRLSAETYAQHLHPKGNDPVWKEILVPVDFSPCAENAVEFALGLALASGASLHLMHAVYLPLPVPGVVPFTIDQMQSEALANLVRMAQELREWLFNHNLPAVTIKVDTRIGFAAVEIVAGAKHYQSDLIVLGTQGADGAEAFFIGSNAASVVRHAECPVLVVPKEAVWAGVNRVGYATDLEIIDTDVLTVVANLARMFDAEIETLHVTPDSEALPPQQIEAFENKVREHYPDANLRCTDYGIEDHDISGAIEHMAEAHAFDVLVLYRRERKGFSGLLHRSLTKKMALHAKLPLLVCH
jgi:nucleotide-binding universal stress UspA family protein